MSILLALILSAHAHVTSSECQTLYQACLSRADVVVTPLPIDPPVRPETPPAASDGKAWECYYKSLSPSQQKALREIARKRGWTPEEATIWHYEEPGWGGRARGAKWGCETAGEASGDAISANRWHHVNHASGSGFGTAVSLCNGDEAKRVELEGESWVKHGRLDRGREIWFTPSRKTGLEGTLRITLDDGTVIVSEIRGKSGMTEGDC